MLRTGLKSIIATNVKFLKHYIIQGIIWNTTGEIWGKKAERALALILLSSELEHILKSQVYTLVYKERNNYGSAPVTTAYDQTAC